VRGRRLPVEPSPGQEDVLAAVRALLEAGEAASAIAIAARLGMSRQHVSRQLALLERKGLLVDKPKVVRSGHWALTPAGKRL
jgi:Mn-dependent DtxR family transcriptional regulator